MVASIALAGQAAQAQVPAGRPLTASNFMQAAPRGFGDRQNSWAQAMAWWQNNLYVGTSRASDCASLFAIWLALAENYGVDVTNKDFPYPPLDPNLSCAPGPDLPLQAEIWRWTPGTNTWTRVFQSPLALDNPGTHPLPPPPQLMWQGKKLPYDIAFRGMSPFTEPNGTEALYAFGINSAAIWDPLPAPRILRSTDGINWAPVPQDPGTFLADLTVPNGFSSFRSPVAYNGKLFVLAGALQGQGLLIASSDPAKGDNAWFLAGPPGVVFYELAVFNGWLYLGGFDQARGGYTVVKTQAQGTPPYSFTTIVPSGAYLTTPFPSQSVVSMHEFFGRLYVGTASFTEVIRINPDDTWDLVVGPPRTVPLADGSMEWKYPISGLDNGWGQTLNDHAWSEDDPYGFLYFGTFNAATSLKNDPVLGPLLAHSMGANLYRTHDGWYYSAITTNGFANPSDPHGGIFDFGIRTMASTPHGFFLGTANDYYGLAIFLATSRGPNLPDPPDRVEVEQAKNGSALLSWNASAVASRYHIWRAQINPIQARANPNFEGFPGQPGQYLPDTYIAQYTQIAVSQAPVYIDSTVVQPGQRYMYYVQVENQTGNISDQSNLVAFPLLTPAETFAQLLHQVDILNQRQQYKNPTIGVTLVRQMIANAQTLAANCRIGAAINTLNPQMAFSNVVEPDATDLEIQISKLLRRLQLFNQFANQVNSDEFCTSP
jgi:hypothetical protein